jgi:hypothetical protein
LLLGELHRDSEIPRVQGQIDAIVGFQATLEIFAAQQMGSNKNEQAEIYLKRALPMNEKAFGAESVELAHNYEVLAVVYQTQNKLDLQESSLKQEIAILEKLPKESVRLSIASQNLGDFYFRQKNIRRLKQLTCNHSVPQRSSTGSYADERRAPPWPALQHLGQTGAICQLLCSCDCARRLNNTTRSASRPSAT